MLAAAIANALPAGATDSEAAITDAYQRLARADEAADTAALRTVLSSDFTLTLTNGASENLEEYAADWADSKKQFPSQHVAIRVVKLTVRGDAADAEIELTQSDAASKHSASEVQSEADRWQQRNGVWMLVSARTLSDTVWIDGSAVSSDSGLTPLTPVARKAIVAQLKQNAWPIRTASPGGSSQDLEPLRAAIGPARLVAMGEATHGTSEFFSLKDRIFRMLVEKMGFTVFAMETPWISGLAIDRYITTGQGNARQGLSATFAVWNNQEVLDLIEWMRAYNLTRGSHPAIHFVGIDMQEDPFAFKTLIERFVAVAHPADSVRVSELLRCLTIGKPAASDCVAATAEVARIVAGDARGTALGKDQILRAEHAAAVAHELAEMQSEAEFIDQANTRDRSMAANVTWFASTAFPGARIAVWAHDGHVMASRASGMIPMGTYLRQRFGGDYYVIGFAFDRGSVSPNGLIPPVGIGAAPPYASEAVLRSSGMPLYGLNLRAISPRTPLGEFLSDPEPMRTLGAFSNPSDARDSQAFGNQRLKDAFDTLIFVETMHAAHSFRQGDKTRGMRAFTVAGGSGGVSWPTEWMLAGYDPSNYATGGNAPTLQYPSGLLWILSGSGRFGVTAGRIPVAPYRGKRIRLSGRLLAKDVEESASAWMRVDTGVKTAGIDTMSDRALSGTTGWTPFSITLDVPGDASLIAFGLMLKGSGSLWATDLRITVVAASTPSRSGTTTGVRR